MKQLTCEMCGSIDLVKQDGVFVCQACGCKYSTEEAKKMMVEVVGEVKVENIANRESLLKRGQMFLSEGKFDEANRYFEQVLDIDPECAEAYFGKLMIKYKVTEVDDLVALPLPIAADEDYRKFARFATDEQREKAQSQYIESRYFFMNRILNKYGRVTWARRTPVEPTEEIRKIAKNGLVTNFDQVKNIKILDGQEEISDSAFANCRSLTSVTIPGSVKKIGSSAFSGCSSLVDITIQEGVKFIKDHVFSGCSSLVDIIIPESVGKIADHLFFGCSSLISVTIPGSVRWIGDSAFSGCTSLTGITIPRSVSLVGDSAFSGCTSLTDITIAGGLGKANRDIFKGCTSLTNIIVLDGVKKINDWGFSGCTSLTNITIPDSVEEIDPSLARLIPLCKVNASDKIKRMYKSAARRGAAGCYVATAVYGSYDCPQVWTLRRFRDYTLAKSWYGRAFIHAYYAISPTLVKWFGNTNWFKRMWQGPLDRMVAKLQSEGVESTPYEDRAW